LMRGREFLMKDGYSFHSSNEDMVREFDLMEQTYKNILNRLELDFRVVEADSGAIGGNGSKELMVIANSGEDTLLVCSECEYGANVEAAHGQKLTNTKDTPEAEFNKFKTPNITSINDLSNFFRVDSYYFIKAVIKKAIFKDEEKIVAFFLRGDDELQDVKALNILGADSLEDANENDLESLAVGFVGPLDLDGVEVILDDSLRGATNMICGANEIDYHFVGVDLSVLDNPNFKDIRTVKEGDLCPHCQATLVEKKGIEVGHIFQLGDVYSKPLKATFLDENGKEKPLIMGTYGIGVSRLVAAVIEQNHDDKGCIWTRSTAPFIVNILVSNIKDELQLNTANKLYEDLNSLGIESIIDDRKDRFGFKMNDAELIGFPYTVIIGKSLKEGNIEVYYRKTKEKIIVDKEHIIEYLQGVLS